MFFLYERATLGKLFFLFGEKFSCIFKITVQFNKYLISENPTKPNMLDTFEWGFLQNMIRKF